MRQIAGEDSATLVHGVDRYGHFEPEPRLFAIVVQIYVAAGTGGECNPRKHRIVGDVLEALEFQVHLDLTARRCRDEQKHSECQWSAHWRLKYRNLRERKAVRLNQPSFPKMRSSIPVFLGEVAAGNGPTIVATFFASCASSPQLVMASSPVVCIRWMRASTRPLPGIAVAFVEGIRNRTPHGI